MEDKHFNIFSAVTPHVSLGCIVLECFQPDAVVAQDGNAIRRTDWPCWGKGMALDVHQHTQVNVLTVHNQ